MVIEIPTQILEYNSASGAFYINRSDLDAYLGFESMIFLSTTILIHSEKTKQVQKFSYQQEHNNMDRKLRWIYESDKNQDLLLVVRAE